MRKVGRKSVTPDTGIDDREWSFKGTIKRMNSTLCVVYFLTLSIDTRINTSVKSFSYDRQSMRRNLESFIFERDERGDGRGVNGGVK